MKNYPRLNHNVRIRKEGDDWVILTPGGRLIAVNPTGKLIVDMCTGDHTIDDIARKLGSLSQSPNAAEVRAQLDIFLVALETAKCIDFSPDQYEPPIVEVVLSTGRRKFGEVDPEYFLSFIVADPPC